jgi:hypothetical protein
MKMNDLSNSIGKLSEDFWLWRSYQQPRSHDDIPRIERAEQWIPQWSSENVDRYRREIAEFEKRLGEIQVGGVKKLEVEVDDWIDHQLLRIAMARVRWELDILRLWQRQPRFYVDQTIGTVFDVLTRGVIGLREIEVVIRLFESFSQTLRDARINLIGNSVKEFAQAAIDELSSIQDQLPRMAEALGEEFFDIIGLNLAEKLKQSSRQAANELVAYRAWIEENIHSMSPLEPIGQETFRWFLSNVALLPFSCDEMINIGILEMDRATVLEALSKNKHRNVPIPPLPVSAVVQSENEARLETQVRDFYMREGILSQPEEMKHYLNAPLPNYLTPIRWLGVTDDLTGPSRLNVDGVSYVPIPSEEMPYFYAANARDPRAGIVHEGAHYQQLVLAWNHPRKIRRHYFDSGSNEGIAFYNEELMLAAGLFDDAPHSQALMYNFMKLRALRVVIDVSLATGVLDIESATRYLVEKVPMDEVTAREEATFFASCPGQGLTYQIGKTQIMTLLADVMRVSTHGINLQAFHDYLWVNGNVPIALQRFGILRDSADLERIGTLSK